MEVGGPPTLLAVGAEDEFGRRRCNRIGQVMIFPSAPTPMPMVRLQGNGGTSLYVVHFLWGRESGGCETTESNNGVFLSLALILVVKFLGRGGMPSGL